MHSIFTAPKGVAVAVAIALQLPFTAYAEQAPIVVTATRTAQTADEVLASVTVVTRADIERSQAPSVLELLRGTQGVDIARTGGKGTDTSLFLRGTNSNHVLVLIDGVRAASTTNGAMAWAHLPLAQIERIEIVRGPKASLYGSDAIGGVIQIFTRRNEGANAHVTAGSFGTQTLQAGWGGGEVITFSVQAGIERSDGFSSQNENNSFFDAAAGDGDDDGYDNRNISLRANTTIGQQTELDANFLHSNGDVEFDTGEIDSINQTASIRLNHATTENWNQTLVLGHSRDELTTESSFSSQINSRRNSIDWQNDLILDDHILTLGLNYYEDDGENIDRVGFGTDFDESIDNSAAFAQLQSELHGHNIIVSARRDKHSDFGGHNTGQISWGKSILESTSLSASYGTAFKAPSLVELFHPGFGGFFAGNPNLDPERSRSTEIGVRFAPNKAAYQLSIHAFKTEVEDLIAYEGVNNQAINIQDTSMKGLELEVSYRHGPWTSTNTMTWQQARDDADDSQLLRRPDRKLSMTLDRTIGDKGASGVELFASSSRADFGNVTLPGYGLVNLYGNYALNKQWTLEGRIENLTDKEYELASGFNTAERSFMVGLRFQP